MLPPPRPIVATPSLTDEDEDDMSQRRQMSPSPEVDLSSPDLDEFDDNQSQPSTPGGALPPPHTASRHISIHSQGARAPSPALEKDEREFTQTVAGLQKRKLSGNLLEPTSVEMEYIVRDEGNLFGEPKHLTAPQQQPYLPFVSSPAMRPSIPKKDSELESFSHLDGMLEWDKCPENVGLDELDGLLDQF